MTKLPRRAAILCATAIVLAFTASATTRALGLAGSATQPDSAQTPVQETGSSDGVWTIAASRTSQDLPEGRSIEGQHVVVWLNRTALESLLRVAPREVAGRPLVSPSEITLPLPDGSFARFRFEESSILAPELAAAYPEFRTYHGQGIDDPAATTRFGWTAAGFHAILLNESGSFYIDAYAQGDLDRYISYRKLDYRRQGSTFICLVGNPDGDPLHRVENVFPLSHGGTLRTYRLALAATGEYTAAAGGTKALALARMTATMNRVNGIYERDLAVRMTMATGTPGDPTALIYTDGNADPYTNDNGGAMLGENQANVDAVVGPANYDIGHVFSTGGGGIAYLQSPCNDSLKAGGVTGSSNPTGDAFDVDYVSHEMGHQFGGHHTFNGSTGNCVPRPTDHAYEVGSGVTIQGYAGICGVENLQPNSIDRFHVESLDEITAFLTSGGGSTCGVGTPTGNTPPTVNAGPSYTIPQQTPFMLTATGSDANGDSLTYAWDQFDLGTVSNSVVSASTDDGTRPLFRSYSQTSSPSRVFPSAIFILNNANVPPMTYPCSLGTCLTGETLPSTNRTMTFQVTARDNRAGGGGISTSSTQATVTTIAGPFRVTAPNTAVSVTGGSALNVTWDVAGTAGAPVSAANVRILLSTNGGATFPTELVASTPNDGSHTLNIPNTPTTTARIMIQAVGNIFFDVSDTNFTIASGATLPTLTPTPATVAFGAVNSGGVLTSATPAQTITVQQSGGTALAWTASANVSWLTIAAADAIGNGTGQFSVTLNNTGGVLPATGTVNGTITITAPGAQTNPTIPVTATTYAPAGTQPPFGLVDTPLQGTVGVVGTIGMTGWVLDDVGVSGVQVYRNCLAFEPPENCVPVLGQSLVFVGDATLVSGARPDVEAIYPTAPLAHRAAWGYLLLTNLLPHVPNQVMFGGQGPVTLFAVARDAEGQAVFLGRTQVDTTPTSIGMDNDHIAKPFGAIDTPLQGETKSGVFPNFGWALTPDGNTVADGTDILVPVNGSTLRVYIDGAPGATIGYNQCRGTILGLMPAGQWCDDDVANIFGNPTPLPTFTPRTANVTKHRNLDVGRGAIGALLIDTRLLANGVHTIMWGVTDTAGRGDGIGSRYFTVLNTGTDARAGTGDRPTSPDALPRGFVEPGGPGASSVSLSRRDTPGPRSPVPGPGHQADVFARTGFSLDAPFTEVVPDADGVRHVRLGEIDRLELRFAGSSFDSLRSLRTGKDPASRNPASSGLPVTSGYLVANGEYRPLPVGSHLDTETGTFTWAPGVGFVGTYRLAFGAPDEASFPRTREPSQSLVIDVTIRPVAPPAPGEAAIRMALDLPQPGATVRGAFVVAGWALDPQAAIGAGIGAVHVWAQRTDVAGAAPVFLGAAALEGARPDVAQAFGAQFAGAGYNLAVGTAGSKDPASSDSVAGSEDPASRNPASMTLSPGTYAITAYVWNTRTARWEDAQTVSVTAR